MYNGIDVSFHDSNLLYAEFANSIDFAIVREGSSTNVDSMFKQHVNGFIEAGVKVPAVYHFIYSTTKAQVIEEAKACIANVEKVGLPKTTIMFMDFEYDSVSKALLKGVQLTSYDANLFAKTWCEYMEEHGYVAGVYANKDYYLNWFTDHTLFDRYPLWLCDLNGDPDYPCAVHQYSWLGRHEGALSDLDMDFWFDEDLYNGVNNLQNPKQKEIIAEDVLAVAKGWLGVHEGSGEFYRILNTYNSHTPLARGYAIKPNDEWCDCFVSACAIAAGAVDLIGTEVSCQRHIDIFKEKGIWIEDGNITPLVGDIVVFNWDENSQPNDGWADHIGYVYTVDAAKGVFSTIEGNSNEEVRQRWYDTGDGNIRGFARPKYGKTQSSSSSSSRPKLSTHEVAEQVVAGLWGNGDERRANLSSAGYSYEEIQAEVNKILGGHPSTPTKDPLDVAMDVIAGEYGNGEERKQKLTDLGYDYAEIQRIVNELLNDELVDYNKIVDDVIAGKYGNGEERKRKLEESGYDYKVVQEIVNEKLS